MQNKEKGRGGDKEILPPHRFQCPSRLSNLTVASYFVSFVSFVVPGCLAPKQ